MRQIPAAIAVLGLSALALVGCAASTPVASDGCERTASESSVLDLIETDGDFGEPDAATTAPVHATETAVTEVIEGDGLAVTTRAQDVIFTTTILNGTTGAEVVSSGTVVQPVTQWAMFAEGMASMLECATEGSRIVGVVAPDDISDQAAANLQLGEDDSAVVVIDLEKVYLAAANGAPQYVDGAGIPTVVLASDGRPGIVVPDAPAPTDLVIKTLKKGDGEEITADAVPRVHYTGVLWETGDVFDSSWESGASAAFSLDSVVPGFAQALEGQTVGSQILAVIPPELGYGEQASGSIPANSTLVFVIDILGTDEAAAVTQ